MMVFYVVRVDPKLLQMRTLQCTMYRVGVGCSNLRQLAEGHGLSTLPPCATCIWLLLHCTLTCTENGLYPLQLALVALFLPSASTNTPLALVVVITWNLLHWWCFSCHQLTPILHLHLWWSSLGTCCTGGVFPKPTSTLLVCTSSWVCIATCTVLWWWRWWW